MRRKVLVIAYYFPPLGLSGVQRTAKFVKYLPEFGWEPTVLTVQPAGYFAFDASLLREIEELAIPIVRTPSVDPTRLFGRNNSVALPEGRSRKWADWLTGILFIPDNKLGWFPIARRRAAQIMRRTAFDALLSTAPPYTGHLIASSLSRKTGIPLVTDFRDDWLGNPRHSYPTRLHRRAHRCLEQRVLATSSAVVTINDVIADSLRRRMPGNSSTKHIAVIEQGFDPDDFSADSSTPGSAAGPFRLLYTGVFYDAQRPDSFLYGLAEALRRRPDLRHDIRADFVGLVPSDFDATVDRLTISDIVRYHGYLPHDETVQFIRSTTVPWMIVGRRDGARSISTGKLFEYFGSRKPVLALVPDGTARDTLRAHGAAEIVDPDNVPRIADAILSLYDRYESGTLPAPDPSFVDRFDRRSLTGRLADVLNRSSVPVSERATNADH